MDTDDIDALTKAVADILKWEFLRSGLSYDDLERETDLSRSTIGRLLNGRREASVSQLVAMAEALRLDASGLLADAHELAVANQSDVGLAAYRGQRRRDRRPGNDGGEV